MWNGRISIGILAIVVLVMAVHLLNLGTLSSVFDSVSSPEGWDRCCNSCEDVRQSYVRKGWSFGDPDGIEQVCAVEGKQNEEIANMTIVC
jgi:hypothetical protein